MIAVHEIGVRARPSPASTGCAARGSSSFHPICGIFSAGSDGSIATTSPGTQPSPDHDLEFAAPLGHQLHADADAEKRPAAPDHRLVQAPLPARHGGEAARGNRRRRRPRAARCASAAATSSGRLVTTIAPDPALAAARSNALAAERRLPEP
jgi:hypothetical protein